MKTHKHQFVRMPDGKIGRVDGHYGKIPSIRFVFRDSLNNKTDVSRVDDIVEVVDPLEVMRRDR